MKEVNYSIHYKVLNLDSELPPHLHQLLTRAREAVDDAYAPYSNFKVGAAVLLENGNVIKGSNQENASLPVGICAERVAFSAASAAYPKIPVLALAISAKAKDYLLNEPVSPCGLCRQTILEYEERFNKNIEIVLQSNGGEIFWISTVKDLLPLSFKKY